MYKEQMVACERSQNDCDGGARKRASGWIYGVDFVFDLLNIHQRRWKCTRLIFSMNRNVTGELFVWLFHSANKATLFLLSCIYVSTLA